MTEAEKRALEEELARISARIEAAYWRFTRQARALPPVLAVPGAYVRRREILLLLGRPPVTG